MHKPQRAPAGLGNAGSRIWRSLTTDVIFRSDELLLLEQAARTADQIAEYEEAVKSEPLTVRGSAGQLVAHPLRVEIRALRAALATFLGRLNVPEEAEENEETDKPMTRRESAKKAARARWSNRG